MVQTISTITNDDYCAIVATFTAMTNPTFRCSVCVKNKYPKDQKKRARHEELMLCKVTSKKPRHYFKANNFNRVNYFTCIGNLYNPEWASWINYYELWQKGILPYSGSYEEQPAKFVEFIHLVQNLIENDNKEKQDSLKKIRHGRQSSKR